MSQSEVLFKDYFSILEVSPFASDAVIQSSYRALARVYHPDLQGLLPEHSKTMADINEAYDVLSNTIKKEGYWELFLQEYIKKEQIRGKHFYFYKNWEESLRKREKELSEHKLSKSSQSSNKGIEHYIDEFLNSSGTKLQNIVREIKKAPSDIQEEFLNTLILSPYLSLEMERELLSWILKDKKPDKVPFISKGFKYKDLYPLLLDYICYYEIVDYHEKILLIAKQMDIRLESNLSLAILLLTLNFPIEIKSSLIELGKKDWLILSFWQRKQKSKVYQKSYKELRRLLESKKI